MKLGTIPLWGSVITTNFPGISWRNEKEYNMIFYYNDQDQAKLYVHNWKEKLNDILPSQPFLIYNAQCTRELDIVNNYFLLQLRT